MAGCSKQTIVNSKYLNKEADAMKRGANKNTKLKNLHA